MKELTISVILFNIPISCNFHRTNLLWVIALIDFNDNITPTTISI